MKRLVGRTVARCSLNKLVANLLFNEKGCGRQDAHLVVWWGRILFTMKTLVEKCPEMLCSSIKTLVDGFILQC